MVVSKRTAPHLITNCRYQIQTNTVICGHFLTNDGSCVIELWEHIVIVKYAIQIVQNLEKKKKIRVSSCYVISVQLYGNEWGTIS